MVEYQAGSLTFKLDLSQPLYEQVLDQLRLAVARGEIEPGAKIPSIREMAHYLKVNPNTIMRAYQELDRDELIETRRGQGTYITSSSEKVEQVRQRMAASAIETFIDSMKKLGIDRRTAESFLEEADWQ